MPSLSLYFPLDFPDPTLAGHTHRLELPRPDSEMQEYVLGRAANLALTLAVRNISRRHCSISYSYAADRWAIQDLKSLGGTWLYGQRLTPYTWAPIGIGDRFHLSSNPAISVVEDEHDTVNGDADDDGPATVASPSAILLPPAPNDHLDGVAPPLEPPPPKTVADTLYLGASWLITPTTGTGMAYRLIVVGLAAVVAVLIMGAT
jgi:pSer/pThr/pTyr-binding forkhead associated (FHA) protein